MEFKFELGSEARDTITGFSGIIVCRAQWIHNCNTYTLQPTELQKDGSIKDTCTFDEPALKLIEEKIVPPKRDTGGPRDEVPRTNR